MNKVYGLIVCCLITITNIQAQPVYPSQVREALSKAGSNRACLESVLNHYQKDKERYAAACYLIANMPMHSQAGKIVWYDPKIDSILNHNDQVYYNLIKGTSGDEQEKDPLHERIKLAAQSSAKLLEQLKLKEPQIREHDMPDITTLNGEYIQKLIDQAFSLRNRIPRLKSMPLHDFFEYVLAYSAIPDYPLISDKIALHNIFDKYLQVDTAQTARCISERYNRAIWWLGHWGGTYPFENTLGWRELFFTSTDHDCVDIANYAAMIYRACGWPAAVEYNTAYKVFSGRHFNLALPSKDWHNQWNAYNSWQSFSPQSELPQEAGKRFQKCLNIFRLHFAPVADCPYALKSADEPIPQELESPFIEDVSHLYTSTAKLELPLSQNIPDSYQLAYLASFTSGSGLTTVTWGKIDKKNKRILFDHVVTDHIYFPVYVSNEHKLVPFGLPFKIDKTTKAHISITPHSPYYHSLLHKALSTKVATILTRKFPRKPQLYEQAKRAVGTYIIASNSENFENADTLGTLSFMPEDVWSDIPLHPTHPYQYYRICAPAQDPHIHLAEIQFLSLKSRNYTNTIAPTMADTSLYQRLMDEPLEKCKWKAEYDGNYQTAPDRWPNVTLKQQEPQFVDCLHFMIKNADNHIRAHHFYTLYQWTDKGWERLSQGEAKEDALPRIPLYTNHLYWISDMTEGKEELPFFFNEGGNQIFPHEWLLSEE